MFQKSIRNKLIVLLLLVTIIPFGSAIFVTNMYTKQTLTNQAIQTNLHLLYQGKVNIESYLNELNNHTLSIYRNVDFLQYLKYTPYPSDYIAQRVISNMLMTILFTDSDIEKVSLSELVNESYVTASRRSSVVYSVNVQDPNIENNLLAMKSRYNLSVKSKNNSLPQKKGINSFSLHRSIVNVPSSAVLGFLSLEVTPNKLLELSKHLYNEENEEFYIVSPQGDFIYNSNGLEDLESWKQKLQDTKGESGFVDWKDESFHGVMIYETMSDSLGGWMLVKRLPNTTLYESAYDVAIINIAFGIIGLSIAVVATLFVSYKITSPIRILVKNIRQVEKGNMQAQFDSLGKDEIGVLGERFKKMMERINQLIDREYKLELENKTNQLKALQSQINPHFLYNTLQSIGTMALKNQPKKVYTALTDLSQIMRYCMNTEERFVSLTEEVNYVRSYLLLQRQRFGDDFHYFINVEENVNDVKVPKMILQPIIENYFKHGFHSNEGIGKLQIECKRKEESLFIKISDNGSGVSKERLTEILYYLSSPQSQGDGNSNIGLKNVYRRLKLYYSEKATFELYNSNEGGFIVIMKLPLEYNGN